MDPKPTVLLIEDEKDLSDALRDILEGEGISVLQAFNGEEGLKLALDKKPYLILLDLYMPVMDGITFLTALRKNVEYGATARVIVLSNVEDREKVEVTKNLNILDYIIKANWGIQEIADRVKSLILI